jgi:hypothetical protein
MFQRRPGCMVFTPMVAPRWRERGEGAAPGRFRRLMSATVCARQARRRGSSAAGAVLVLTISGTCWAQTVRAEVPLHWAPFLHVPGVVDLTGPRRDGSITVTAAGQLFLLQPSGALRTFARGPGGYATDPGAEVYLALARRRRVPGAHCAFRRDDVYALEVAPPGVVVVDASGQARPFASLPAGTFPNGITFDEVGRFGRRLLVTAGLNGATNVYAIDCRGGVRTIAQQAPRVEGGIAVAPRSFGRFAGQLIAPDEVGGGLVAIDARGRASTVVDSGLAAGGDIGVESVGFVPTRFGVRGAAFLADRGTPGNPHPGTDSILTITGSALIGAGVRAGDLLVGTEGGADTIAVRCRRTCTVRRIADGPAVAHAEGHIVFARLGGASAAQAAGH